MRALRPFGLILLATLLVRLPFFFPAVVDWDESTFILIGQSMLDGHLPYVHLWDLKPPLLFAFYAAAIGVFGESIVGVRLAGAACVASTAWFVYLIAVRWGSASAAWLAAGLCIVVSSLIESGQATMSEHVAMPAVMGAVSLWLRGPRSARTAFWVGALMAVATLVRLNLAAGAVAFGLVMAIDAVRRTTSWRPWLAYTAGGLTVLAVTCLPFALAGHLRLVWTSVVLAGLARSEPGGGSRLVELLVIVLQGGSGGAVLWIGVFLWGIGLAGVARMVGRNRPGGAEAPAGVRLLVAVGGAITASIVLGGGAFAHYWIQVTPFAAVFAVAFVSHARRPARVLVWGLAAALTVLSLRPVAGEYVRFATRVLAGQPLSDGPAPAIAAYLRQENPEKRPVFLLTDHLAYWLLKADPPSGLLTHPSVLARERVLNVLGTTAREQLERAFALAPEFVVVNPGEWFLEGDVGRQLSAVLAEGYERVTVIDGRDVYRRRGR